MTAVTTIIEFIDPLQHAFDANFVELSGGHARLKSQALSSEILFSNFDVNNVPLSKRGDKTVIFEGVENTGEVKDGVLKFPNEDRSIASYKNITSIVDDFAFRARVESNILTTVQEREIARLVSNIDASEIRFFLQNQGGGTTRVRRDITNSAGSLVSSIIIATVNLSTSPNYNIAFSNVGNTENRTYFNGQLVSTVTFTNMDFTDCDLIFGDNTALGRTASSNYDNIQLWNSDAIQTDFEFPFPEPTTYVKTPQQISTSVPIILDSWAEFKNLISVMFASEVRHQVCRNSTTMYWFNTVSSQWELVDMGIDLYGQTNTAEEIETNLPAFPLTVGIGVSIEISSFLKSSTDGYTTPLLDQMTFKYGAQFKAAIVGICAVLGTVVDMSGNPIVGATVKVDSQSDFFNSSLFVGRETETTTDSNGNWSLSVIETTSIGVGVTFEIGYTENSIPKTFKVRNKLIPNEITKNIINLFDAPEV